MQRVQGEQVVELHLNYKIRLKLRFDENTGSAFNSLLQNDRLLASLHHEHYGVYPCFSHIPAGPKKATSLKYVIFKVIFFNKSMYFIKTQFLSEKSEGRGR